jgi:colicin import membrane protein
VVWGHAAPPRAPPPAPPHADAGRLAAEEASSEALARTEQALADFRQQAEADARQARTEYEALAARLEEERRSHRTAAAQAAAESAAEVDRLRAELARAASPRLHPDDLQAVLSALTTQTTP